MSKKVSDFVTFLSISQLSDVRSSKFEGLRKGEINDNSNRQLRISTKFRMMDYFVSLVSNIDCKYSITNRSKIVRMMVLIFYLTPVSKYTQWARIGG